MGGLGCRAQSYPLAPDARIAEAGPFNVRIALPWSNTSMRFATLSTRLLAWTPTKGRWWTPCRSSGYVIFTNSASAIWSILALLTAGSSIRWGSWNWLVELST